MIQSILSEVQKFLLPKHVNQQCPRWNGSSSENLKQLIILLKREIFVELKRTGILPVYCSKKATKLYKK